MKISVIVSISFLVSYFPITLYLLLKESSNLFYRIAVLMLWIDNFVNPLVIILDNRWAYCRLIRDKDSPETPVKLTAKSSVNEFGEIALDSPKIKKSKTDFYT